MKLLRSLDVKKINFLWFHYYRRRSLHLIWKRASSYRIVLTNDFMLVDNQLYNTFEDSRPCVCMNYTLGNIWKAANSAWFMCSEDLHIINNIFTVEQFICSSNERYIWNNWSAKYLVFVGFFKQRWGIYFYVAVVGVQCRSIYHNGIINFRVSVVLRT